MKKTFLNIQYLIVLLLTITGCNFFDDHHAVNQTNAVIMAPPKVIGNRLSFTSHKGLLSMIATGRNNDSLFNTQLHTFKKKGFASLIVTPNEQMDQEQVNQLLERKQKQFGAGMANSRSSSLPNTDESPLIADPVFSELLNEAHEIIVADSLYKYTPYGLFVSLANNYPELLAYLKKLDPQTAAQLPATGHFEPLTDYISYFKPILKMFLCRKQLPIW